MVSESPPLHAVHLGVVPYTKAFELQERIVRRQIDGELPDVLLTLEHPPTITIGISGDSADIRVEESLLLARNIELVKSNRGGKATYHGPGQLVVYPLIELKRYGPGLRDYLSILEDVTISTLGDRGVQATRVQGKPGVWVEERKIASIGIRLRRGRTMHGIAINLTTDLTHFDFFVPCGMPEIRMTSLAMETGAEVQFEDVRRRWIEHFSTATQVSIRNLQPAEFMSDAGATTPSHR